MKRIKALIALISVCLTLSFTFVSGVVSASAWEVRLMYISYRMYSTAYLTDESVEVQFVFTDSLHLEPGIYSIFVKNGDKKLLLYEYDALPSGYGTTGFGCMTISWFRDESASYRQTFRTDGHLVLNIPMEFFEGEGGVVELLVEPREKFDLRRNLSKIAYSKSENVIYFSSHRGW